MQVMIYPVIAIILLLLNNLITTYVPLRIFHTDLYFIPHLLLIYLLILTVYKNPKIALILSIFTGILCDVYLGNIYGLYTFGFIISVLLMDQLFKVFYKDIKMMVVLLLFFVMLFEHFMFIIMKILGFISTGYFTFILTHLVPTLLLNFLFIVIVFPLLLKLLDKYSN